MTQSYDSGNPNRSTCDHNLKQNGRSTTIGNERKINYQYIGLVAGILIGAVFAHVEYDKWYLGALVGSGIGPMIGYALQMRFGND